VTAVYGSMGRVLQGMLVERAACSPTAYKERVRDAVVERMPWSTLPMAPFPRFNGSYLRTRPAYPPPRCICISHQRM